MSDYETQLAVALQQLSQQHEQQLHDVLQQVATLANEVTKLATLNQQQMQRVTDAPGKDSQSPSMEQQHDKAAILSAAALQYQRKTDGKLPACLQCKNALFYISGDVVFFNCLISRLEQPVMACSQLALDD